MKRTRLTNRRNAADMSIPYPGNVNQPDRKDPSWEQYHTFEQQVNHELPDMRHEWKDDTRDEIGFGLTEKNPPTVASIRVAANKAVRIAVLLLGEKVEDKTIEAQARDLMALSQESMDRTLDRFAQTQKLYAEEEKEEKVEEKEEKKASAELADKGKDVPKTIEAPKQAEKVEDKKEEKVEEKKAQYGADEKTEEKKEEKVEEKKAAADEKKMPDFIKEKIEEKKEKEEKKDASSKKSEDESEEEEEEEEKTAKNAGEMDIELTGSMDEVAADEEADKQLAACFDDNFSASEEEEEKEEKKASKKAGIKKLGGQPKVASVQTASSVDISSLWNSAPDVSDIFR